MQVSCAPEAMGQRRYRSRLDSSSGQMNCRKGAAVDYIPKIHKTDYSAFLHAPRVDAKIRKDFDYLVTGETFCELRVAPVSSTL